MTSRLLALPGELRNTIYSYALAPVDDTWHKFGHDTYQIYVNKKHDEGERDTNYEFWPVYVPGISIIYTSKQIHDEAAAVLYGSIPFVLYTGITHFLGAIGRQNQSKIRHLIVPDFVIGMHWWQFGNNRSPFTFTPLAAQNIDAITFACTRLTTLEITDFSPPPPGDVLDERLVARWGRLDRYLVKALPTLRSTTLTWDGTRKDLCSQPMADLLRFIKDKLGWKIKRVRVKSVEVVEGDTQDIPRGNTWWHDELFEEEMIRDLDKAIMEAREEQT